MPTEKNAKSLNARPNDTFTDDESHFYRVFLISESELELFTKRIGPYILPGCEI